MGAQRVSTREIRKRLGELFDRVAHREDRFVIERKGRAVAGLGRLTQAQADRLADEAKHAARERSP